MNIEFITILPNEDWFVVTVNGEHVHAGHEVPTGVWMALLARAGATIKATAMDAHDYGSCGWDCARCESETG